METALGNSVWLARFAAALLPLRPGLTGLDAVRIARSVFHSSQYLDPENAAEIYAKGLAAAEMHRTAIGTLQL